MLGGNRQPNFGVTFAVNLVPVQIPMGRRCVLKVGRRRSFQVLPGRLGVHQLKEVRDFPAVLEAVVVGKKCICTTRVDKTLDLRRGGRMAA
jgi:hypothetical protein